MRTPAARFSLIEPCRTSADQPTGALNWVGIMVSGRRVGLSGATFSRWADGSVFLPRYGASVAPDAALGRFSGSDCFAGLFPTPVTLAHGANSWRQPGDGLFKRRLAEEMSLPLRVSHEQCEEIPVRGAGFGKRL